VTEKLGRSGADAPSGCQPSASAAEVASSQGGIPNADTNHAPIWRSGIGMAVEAIDAFRREHRMSRRMTPSERAFDALLDKVLQDISEESRVPWNMQDYRGASDCARAALRSIKERRGSLCRECGGEAHNVGGRTLVFHNHPCAALASAMSAGTAETPSEAQGEARQRGAEGRRP
jgi:hypothetical protein